MVKKVLCVLLVLALLAGAVFGVWYFFLRPTPLKGSVDNAYSVTLNLKDNLYYDVLVPNEAKLLGTDEHYVYEFDLLKIGVQDTEPLNVDYKIQWEDRWIWAVSSDDWLLPTVYSFEHNKPYSVFHQFPIDTGVDPETGEAVWVDWSQGPKPHSVRDPILKEETSHIYGDGDYILYTKELNTWGNVINLCLDRLAQATGQPSTYYYDNGKCFYIEQDGYCAGALYINYNTQYAVFARGTSGLEEARAILAKGVD